MIQLPARLLRAAEQIKITLSSHAFAPVREAFLGNRADCPPPGNRDCPNFEELIRPLLEKPWRRLIGH